MNFGQAIAAGFKNYINFSGRACRSEYWYWVLFAVIATIIATIIDRTMFASDDPTSSPVRNIFGLVTFLPGLSIGIRRLHDIDRTGWWVLIAFTLIGLILLWVWACFRGTIGPNRFGPDPLGGIGDISPRPAT
jgi:uncharacterized membrane protein YhaH (DUF805 family)